MVDFETQSKNFKAPTIYFFFIHKLYCCNTKLKKQKKKRRQNVWVVICCHYFSQLVAELVVNMLSFYWECSDIIKSYYWSHLYPFEQSLRIIIGMNWIDDLFVLSCFFHDFSFAQNMKARQRASVKWILSKAFNNRVPENQREPFYRDHEGQDHLKPQVDIILMLIIRNLIGTI